MADLMWTPEIEADIARWKLTGIFPFLNLCACPLSIPARFSYGDLRLFYHVASISSELCEYMCSAIEKLDARIRANHPKGF